MGFKVRPKVYRLRFEDGSELDGATVMVKSLPTGDFLHISGLAERLKDPGQASSETADEAAGFIGMFARALVEWDLEHEDGTPIPCDASGLRELDLTATLGLVFAWMDAVVAVSAPLVKRSDSGARFPEESIPMEPLSSSPGS